MAMHIFLSLLIVAKLAEGLISCTTQTGERGNCVNIKNCRPVMKLLRSRPDISVYDKLRQVHCGNDAGMDPKICCETPIINFANRLNPDLIASMEKVSSSDEEISISTASPATASVITSKLNLLDRESCGPVIAEPHIYGGQQARLFEFPWMALLAYETDGETLENGKRDFRCGATILNWKYVLTAAHCVANLPENLKLAKVRVGGHNLGKEMDCENYQNGSALICAQRYQEFDVERVHAHPDYSSVNLQNDIAIIRIKGAMDFRPASVRPICLPIGSSTRHLVGKVAQVTGWGSREDGQPLSDVLVKVSLPILPHESCARAYRHQPFVRFWYKQLCAGGLSSKDSCNGDSGGPLQIPEMISGQLRMVQYGIVSFGKKRCADKDSPGVYTNVAHYVSWILRNMDE